MKAARTSPFRSALSPSPSPSPTPSNEELHGSSEEEDGAPQENHPKGVEDGTQDHNNCNNNLPMLSCWTASLTDRLFSLSPPSMIAHNDDDDTCDENKDRSFIVLDKVMESHSQSQSQSQSQSHSQSSPRNTGQGKNGDKTETPGFCDHLERELGFFLDKLKPARTAGDHRTDEILKLLQSMGTATTPVQQNDDRDRDRDRDRDQHHSFSSVRGDRSVFVSREYRQRKSFATKHPYLNRLIDTISNTFDQAFRNQTIRAVGSASNSSSSSSRSGAETASIQLDFSQTSVQIALYPGDSKSGYPKHCDREQSCKHEPTGTVQTTAHGLFQTDYTATHSNSNGNGISNGIFNKNGNPGNSEPQRLISVVYYLTNNDWDSDLDGGALRIFRDPNSCFSHTDVIPYRDRMVVFRSDRVEHQVMPSHRRQRLAVTIWFYGTVVVAADAGNAANAAVEPSDIANEDRVPATTAAPRDRMASGSGTVDANKDVAFARLPPPLATTMDGAANGKSGGSARQSSSSSSSSSIFVSIASFRDSETHPTIDALYSMAQNPDRIVVGIVLQLAQGEKDDEDIWNSIHHRFRSESKTESKSWTPRPHQIRCIRLDARDATGPCYARGLCQSLYRGEDYVLQIDSHMRFRRNWDEYLIQTMRDLTEQRRRTESTFADGGGDGDDDGDDDVVVNAEKVVLTAYPVGYKLPDEIPNETRGTYLVPWKFDGQGMLRQRGRLLKQSPAVADPMEDPAGATAGAGAGAAASAAAKKQHVHRQYLYAGGFNFGPGRVIQEVPYDTMGLHHLFFGEELSMAVRLFTHGYDLYAPSESVCYHLWSRAHRPTAIATAAAETATETETSEESKRRLRALSRAIVMKQLLGDESVIGTRYGLGTARTAAAFAERLGVDFRFQRFVRDGWHCGELCSDDFVGSWDGNRDGAPLTPGDISLESKVFSLDPKAQELIGTFLMGMRK